ncbi:hypothetical protein LXL04_002951 [Taraxacum kok-saghyz]
MKEEVAILETVKPKQSLKLQYLQRRIDMLPKPLTEDICSLRADVERLAFSEMTPEAHVISTRYTKSVIKSCAALSYVEAQARMDDSRLMDPVTIDLPNMNALAKIMRQRRIDRGAITLASAEVKFQVDTETHDPLDIGMYQIREANKSSKASPLMFPVAVTCGNTFVLKPSEKDPNIHRQILWCLLGASVMLAELAMEAGTNAGMHIYSRASAKGKRVQSNMGAKNHGIVMPDANIDATLNALVAAGFGAAGQRGLSFLLIMGSLVFTGLVNSLGCAVLAVFLYG